MNIMDSAIIAQDGRAAGRDSVIGVGRSVDIGMLVLVYLVSALSLLGFAVFRLRPELLQTMPEAVPVYARMFVVAPRAQILLAFAALCWILVRHAGLRWLPAFIAVYLLSLGSELAGTTVGFPFGPYRYTDALGVKVFDHVPALIPLSWFFMALPSYAIARRRYPQPGRAVRRIVVGSLVLLSWDLALDPAMSLVTSYWVWGTQGPYYGMPLLNLVGWYVTGLVLMGTLAALRIDGWVSPLPLGWLVAFYGANLLLPVGMSLAAGLAGAVAATAVALVACALIIRAPATATGRTAPERG